MINAHWLKGSVGWLGVCVQTLPCFVSFSSGLSFWIRPVWCFSPACRWVTSEHRASYIFCMPLCLHERTTLYFIAEATHLWSFRDTPGCGLLFLNVTLSWSLMLNSEKESRRVMILIQKQTDKKKQSSKLSKGSNSFTLATLLFSWRKFLLSWWQ